MVRMRYVGNRYNGYDPESKVKIRAVNGDTVEVSEGKAVQLLVDYPDDWRKEMDATDPVAEPAVEPMAPIVEPVLKPKVRPAPYYTKKAKKK